MINLPKFGELSGIEKKLQIEEGERKTHQIFTPNKKHHKTEKNESSIDSLISDTMIEIFTYLKSIELVSCCLTCKNWNAIIKESDEHVWKKVLYHEFAFGKENWNKHFGTVDEEPEIPQRIYKLLKSPCSIFPDEFILKTHLLVLIPKKVNGRPYTLNHLSELCNNPKEGHKTSLDIWNIGTLKTGLSNEETKQSHWVLFSRNILPGSKNQEVEYQEAMVANLSKKTNANYKLPTALEAATCILMNYVKTGIRLLPLKGDGIFPFSNEITNILCSDEILCGDNIHYSRVSLGTFSQKKLVIGVGQFRNFMAVAPLQSL